jgi:hypothetical protein
LTWSSRPSGGIAPIVLSRESEGETTTPSPAAIGRTPSRRRRVKKALKDA